MVATKRIRVRIWAAGAALLAVAVSWAQLPSPIWPQWGQNPQHTGMLNVTGQALNKILANIVYDPLVPEEQAGSGGDLLAHYQVTLLDGNDVFMEFKAGAFNARNFASEKWGENRFHWENGQLVLKWSYTSDWNPPGSLNDFWEPVFHGILAHGFVYVPGAAGTLVKLDRSTGAVVSRITPFANMDANTFTAGPPTLDNAGNIYYNVVKLQDNSDFFAKNPIDSFLVKVSPSDVVTMASYSALMALAGAPGPNDQCVATFSDSQLPWPPSPTAVPPSIACGLQRVALNIAPAISTDGATLYSITRAHFISRYGYVVAINTSNLTLKWAASLRNRFNDGCHAAPLPVPSGSVLPPNGAPGGCRTGANEGVDPATNGLGGGRVLDDSSSSPTVAPDGSVFYGAYSRYNYAQGHLMRFDAAGNFVAAYGFGWDSTPAIFTHGTTYSVVIKDNHYSGLGSYCNVDAVCPLDRTATNPASPEAYFVTQLSPLLIKEWTFQNTNTLSCKRNADGNVSCVSDHPHGFEWCVNAPVVDQNGVVYANSEDGNLFTINQGGTLKQKIFQQLAIGAAYTPTSLGADGKIYSQNAGHLFVVGQ
jgi:hypothetical protein